jgi:hypothetical protein
LITAHQAVGSKLFQTTLIWMDFSATNSDKKPSRDGP